MPGFPIFSTTSQAGDSINPALFEPDERCNSKKWRHAVEKPTVTIEQCGSTAVLDKALFVGEKHEHTRAIFGCVEDLPCLIRLWLKGHLWGMPVCQGTGWAMITQDGRWMQKRLKR